MEGSKDYNQELLINELTRGKELVNELRFHLGSTSSTGELLMDNILSTFNNALLMINWNGSQAEPQVISPPIRMLESPQSRSPRSEDSETRDVYKKRKLMPKWTEQVRVSSGTENEGPNEDGHSWRKYGQKSILGAKHPRGYYRCTHRNAQGCFATKQVQRSDEDPSMFDVTYRGKHTCSQVSPLTQASQLLGRQDQKQNLCHLVEQRKRKVSDDLLQRFKNELKVKTENTREQISSSFSFPTTPLDYVMSENNIFPSLSLEDNYMGSFTSLISPTTPESNYFSPYHMNIIGGRSDFQTSEGDLNEIISATTSCSNSPVIDLDFSVEDFDSNFQFDNSIFFN